MALTHDSTRKPLVQRERLLGIALCAIGASLAIGMAAAAWQNAPTFLHPGQLIDGERFSGSSSQGRLALALFVSVSVTGLAFVAAGAHRAWTGRRDKRLTWLTAFALAVTALLAWLTFTSL
jgi:hypothetical protein